MTRERDAALTLIIEDERWRKQKAALRLMRRAAMIALKNRARGATRRSVTILLSDGRRLRQLNSQFRGRDKATNVLSFNARDDSYLGDIAIAFGMVSKEAREQHKSFAAHAAHLAIHGVLHLLGHDHKKAAEAQAMEALETLILSRLGLPDPYVPVPIRRTRKQPKLTHACR